MAPAHEAQAPTPPPSASVSTFSKSQSFRSNRPPLPSGIKTVVTSPPWARDEPPSPGEDAPPSANRDYFASSNFDRPSLHRPSDVTSYQSSLPDETTEGPSRWWAFTRNRPGDPAHQSLTAHAARVGFTRDRSLSVAWLTASLSRRSNDAETSPRDREITVETDFRPEGADRLRLEMPPPPHSPTTVAQTKTPGWDIPWSPRAPGQTHAWNGILDGDRENDDEKLSRWQSRKKRIRVYILTNTYVPLLFRFVNITFTTSALAIGIRIRLLESRNHIEGVLGSSPTLVIIFAPLTLVHVMIAIYLEYFGRPLGLWRTSAKLAHTLVEVVFICAWSAALALCFDNFFTSIIPCAAASSTSWYNKVQRPPDPFPGLNGGNGVGGTLCNEQIALTCLVAVGLIMYCTNLVISLYRIFEKVKYHPTVRS